MPIIIAFIMVFGFVFGVMDNSEGLNTSSDCSVFTDCD